MGRAIVTFARGWHSLAITRSLGRQGIEVYCGDENAFAPSSFSRYCAGSFRYPSPSEEPEAFLDALEEQVLALKPSDPNEPYVLVPVHKETWLIAKHRERFEPHIKLALTSYENMAATHDKGSLARLATELGLRIPQTREYKSFDELSAAVPGLSFPVFLKMREGAAGVGLKKCEDAADLTATFKDFVDRYGLAPEEYPLVQDFVEGEDYCVTAMFDHGRPVASMTYRNIRAFPRGTGAGALRETVALPEAEAAAETLLRHCQWHGLAQLDFRKAPGGPAYLIELNPRFFGGLPQAIASKVDYPQLYYRLACGEALKKQPAPLTDVRTETPVVSILATLQEIAHDEERLGKLRRVRDELSVLGRSPIQDVRLKPLIDALKEGVDLKDTTAYLKSMFEKHAGAVNDVIQSDDPGPALGVLYPIALMIKHRRISMGLLTGEDVQDEEKPRTRLRDQIKTPAWKTIFLTAALFALSIVAVNWDATAGNLGLILGWPLQLGEKIFGESSGIDSLGGALQYHGARTVQLAVLYLFAALIRRGSRGAYQARAEKRERARREARIDKEAREAFEDLAELGKSLESVPLKKLAPATAIYESRRLAGVA